MFKPGEKMKLKVGLIKLAYSAAERKPRPPPWLLLCASRGQSDAAEISQDGLRPRRVCPRARRYERNIPLYVSMVSNKYPAGVRSLSISTRRSPFGLILAALDCWRRPRSNAGESERERA